MLRQEALISIVGNRLQFQVPDLNRQFHYQLALLLKSGDERAFVVWRDLNVSAWLMITIRHDQGFFRDAVDARLGRQHSSQLVVIEFTSANDQLDSAALASFAHTAGLSPAELALLHLVACGYSMSEAAAERNASVTTVRQQMKSILAKTGCRRQPELICLVHSLCPRRNG
jgi:DNA-binding CsgD family transcriptional regulator